jgi:hypothetical protein
MPDSNWRLTPEWIDHYPDPRRGRHRRKASEVWFWTRVVATLVTWVAVAALVGLVAAVSIAESLP